jgi:hypothetical protein
MGHSISQCLAHHRFSVSVEVLAYVSPDQVFSVRVWAAPSFCLSLPIPSLIAHIVHCILYGELWQINSRQQRNSSCKAKISLIRTESIKDYSLWSPVVTQNYWMNYLCFLLVLCLTEINKMLEWVWLKWQSACLASSRPWVQT